LARVSVCSQIETLILYRGRVIDSHPEGVLVAAWVVPGASADEVIGEHDGALKVRTSAPPEGGKANRRVGLLVAEFLGGRRGAVIAGTASRRKHVLVYGVTLQDARAALDAWRAAGDMTE
jgi:uncharacterized protein